MSKAKRKPKRAKPKKPNYSKVWDPSTNIPLEVFTHGGAIYSAPLSMPTEVRIYGQRYRVLYHSKIYAQPKKQERILGMVIYDLRIIFIDPEQSIHNLRETLYHEVGHVYLKVWQSKSEALSKITYRQMEDFCDLIGEAIPDLAGNNPLPTS